MSLRILLYKGGCDVIIIVILLLVGMVVPHIMLNNIRPWKQEIPGQLVTFNYTNTDNQQYSSNVFMFDPHFYKSHTSQQEATISNNILLILIGPLPFIIVLIFMLLLSLPIFNKNNLSKFKRNWIWPELIGFGYAYSNAMGMTTWITYLLNIFISWPKPDIIDTCNVDSNNIHHVKCMNDINNIQLINGWKSFPCAHSSLIFASMSLCVFFMWTKLLIKKPLYFILCYSEWHYGIFIDLLLGFPWILAWYISIMRVVENFAFPTDILAGSFIGFISGRIGFQTIFKFNSPISNRLLSVPSIKDQLMNNEFLRNLYYPEMDQYELKLLHQAKNDTIPQQRQNMQDHCTTSTELVKFVYSVD
eukprot:168430_1